MNKSSLHPRKETCKLLTEALPGKLHGKEVLITPGGWMTFFLTVGKSPESVNSLISHLAQICQEGSTFYI